MAFSPSPHNPLLLTTSSDGRIKVWALVGDSWRCSASLAYRSFSPVDAAWSRDGSMFAVAYPRSVTLWSLASGSLIHAFPCSTIAPARNIEFVGEEGTALLAGGKHGAMVWDLLTFEGTKGYFLTVSAFADSLSSTQRLSTLLSTSRTLPSSPPAVSLSPPNPSPPTTAFPTPPATPSSSTPPSPPAAPAPSPSPYAKPRGSTRLSPSSATKSRSPSSTSRAK